MDLLKVRWVNGGTRCAGYLYTSHLWFNCSEQCTVRDISPLQCSTEAAMDAFFQDVFSRDAIIALLGSACPQSVQPIAELVHRWNISEVCQTKAYLCVSESFRIFLWQILSSPLVIDSSEESAPMPNLLRLYPDESAVVPALLSLTILSLAGRECSSYLGGSPHFKQYVR